MEEKKNISLKKLKIASLAALAVAALSFGGTWAYYSSTSTIANPLNTSHSGAALVEEFNPDSSFLPGETVVKELKFTNTGEMDLFLRVEVPPEEGWYQKGELQSNLDTAMVKKQWSGSWLDEDEEEPKDLQEWSDSAEWSAAIRDPISKKYYRYYKKILPAGASTNVILESISLSTEVSNDRHDLDYSDKVYKLTFNAEAVPVEEVNGTVTVSSQWNMSVTADTEDNLTWAQGTSQASAGNGN